MRSMLKGIGAGALLLALATFADAASLRVAPTTVEMIAPDSAASFQLSNDGNRPINVQVRVFRWSQDGGTERLEPTNAVVASPPSTGLPAGADYTIRVVRVSKAPVQTEESYRVVVDELPDPKARRPGRVNLVVRHVLPVFFRNPDAPGPQVSWSLSRGKSGLMLTARNDGGTRIRLADVALKQGGKAVVTRKGLVGYVLSGATMQFPLGSGKVSGAVTVSGQTDLGSIEEKVAVR